MQPLAPWGNFDFAAQVTALATAVSFLCAPGRLRVTMPAVGAKPELFANRYEVKDLLAVGPTAAVYRATDRVLGHAVALKILRKDLSNATLAVSRFRHDARLARRVTHPNVARVLDVGDDAGAQYVTRELAPGDTLDVVLEAKRALPLARALSIAVQLTRALAAIHERGIRYCDLMPENVVVDVKDHVVVTDFGATRETGTSTPEQTEGRTPTERSDLYALGALVYQMLTGVPPWGRRAGLATGAARFALPPPPPRDVDPHIPADVSELVMQLLEREPSRRPDSARAVEAILARIAPAAGGPPIAPMAPSTSRGPSTLPPPSTPVSAAPAPVASARAGTGTTSAGPVSAGPVASTRLLRPRALAILPIVDIGDHKRRYVADALASALTDRLAAVATVRVLPQLGDPDDEPDLDPRVAGLRMGADAVLTGSLRMRATEDTRFSVKLVGVTTGEVLWRADIVRSAKDLFKIADEVTSAVVHALDTLAPPPKSTALEPDPGEADPFPRARAALAEHTKEGADDAERGLASAFLRAPHDPVLACWLAFAKLRRWSFDPSLGQGDEAAPVVAERIALEVLKTRAVGEAHLVLATLADLTGDAVLAMQRVRDAVRLSPTLAEAHALAGQLRAEANDVIAGERDLETSLRLDAQVPTLLAMARTRGLLKDYGRATESLYLVDSKVPGHLASALVRLEAAMWSQDAPAIARARSRAIEVATGRSGMLVHAIRVRAGLDADRELGALAAIAATPGCTARARAWILQTVCEERAAAGDHPGAISALRGLDATGSIDLLWIESCPALTVLRGLSGFADVRAAVVARADAALDTRG
jgi:eukaryotic-like serine/threonine-protein kinase